MLAVLTVLFVSSDADAAGDVTGLPTCLGGSICAYLQWNSAGLTAIRVCACPAEVNATSYRPCNMTWDDAEPSTTSAGYGVAQQYKVSSSFSVSPDL